MLIALHSRNTDSGESYALKKLFHFLKDEVDLGYPCQKCEKCQTSQYIFNITPPMTILG